MRPEGFHGPLQRAINLYDGVSEGSAEGVALQLLVALGVIIGPGPYTEIAGSPTRAKTNLLLVGKTGIGRKGTAWEAVDRVLRPAAPDFFHAARLATGPASGEGIIAMVSGKQPDGSPRPLGTQLLVLSTEFMAVATAAKRPGSSLSTTIRNAWDNTALQIGTKVGHGDYFVQDHHVGIIGHITPTELKRAITPNDTGNGFANRFLYAAVHQRNRLPRPNPLNERDLLLFAHDLKTSIDWARTQSRIATTGDAHDYWHHHIYDHYQPENGEPRYQLELMELLTERATGHIARIALTLALLDQTATISPTHLKAARAIWDYSEASAHHAFIGPDTGNPKADRLLAAIEAAGPSGLTGRQQHDVFNRHITAKELDQLITQLQRHGHITVTETPPTHGTGRPTRTLVARGHSLAGHARAPASS